MTFAPNASQTVFYQISYSSLNPDVIAPQPFSVAYDSLFNPSSLSTNYLGDSGASNIPGNPATIYQVIVPAGGELILHFGSTNTAQTNPEPYSFTVEAFSDLNFGENFAGATPLPAALPLFGTGLGALGLLGWRRKRKAAA